MHLPLILAETAGDIGHSHSVSAALPHLLGMLLVIITLAVLWGVCVLSATLIRTFVPEAPAPAPVKASPKPEAPPTGPTPEIIAVISAAVASVTGGSHRIVAIKPQSSSWSKAGRQSVLSSHKIR